MPGRPAVAGRLLDDDATILLRLDNGALGLIAVSQIALGEAGGVQLHLYGDKGSAHWGQAIAAGAARAGGMRSAVHSSSAHSLRIWITSSVMLVVYSAFRNVPILSCVPVPCGGGNTKERTDLGNTN